jgi:hypothetical protein
MGQRNISGEEQILAIRDQLSVMERKVKDRESLLKGFGD